MEAETQADQTAELTVARNADFDIKMRGLEVYVDGEFKNTGKKPIIISEAHGSCGCTVPKWPHDPILPKKKGVIHVTYNTDHRAGPINKTVTITSNAMEPSTVLHITGTVKPKPVEAAKPNNAQAPAPTPVPTPVGK